MSDFRIEFAYPWLTLLLIPALFLALYPHFRIEKRFRRTRNRVVSVVLHTLVTVCSVCILAGTFFSALIPNHENEIIVLIDASDSNDADGQARDEFIYELIRNKDEDIRMSVITFGFTQVYAAPFGYNGAELYQSYLDAELPDTSATDIASALEFASSYITYPNTAKLVLVSDGLETDNEAREIIRQIAATGVTVDTAYFPRREYVNEVQLTGASFPEKHIVQGEQFELTLKLMSSFEGEASVTVYDNGEPTSEKPVEFNLKKGEQELILPHTFAVGGMHELTFSIANEHDTLAENNTFSTYYYLEIFDDLLIVETISGESEKLNELLKESFNTTVVNIADANLPDTVEELRAYDQVVLCNVSNRDMSMQFVTALNSYVKDVGGGLFTVGGDREGEDGKVVANAYNVNDIKGVIGQNSVDRDMQARGKLYQQMLPVEIINYTPPVGVVVLIDRSSSMTTETADRRQMLELAKEGAIECLSYLNSRDWAGLITFEDGYAEESSMIPMTQSDELVAAIDKVGVGGGTVYAGALVKAGEMLNSFLVSKIVQKTHVLIISDGAPGDALFKQRENEVDGYGDVIKRLYTQSQGAITTSVICFKNDQLQTENMEKAAEAGGGKYYEISTASELSNTLRAELLAPEIKDYVPEEFTPRIAAQSSVITGVDQSKMPTLGGFYGTDLKKNAEAPLMGTYVPVYAQWQYGAGRVGSFMSDLNGKWSNDFLTDEEGVGKLLVNNMIKALFPSKNIRVQNIQVDVQEQNYTTQMSIYTNLNEGETIEVTVTSPAKEVGGAPEVQKVIPLASEGFSRVKFTTTQFGLHTILVEKKNGAGEVVDSYTTYRTFSYSKDYDAFADGAAGEEFMLELALRGDGAVAKEAGDVFKSFSSHIKLTYDPTLVFGIIALVAFLLDIAVRKFKFKWIHELIRERKQKKAEEARRSK